MDEPASTVLDPPLEHDASGASIDELIEDDSLIEEISIDGMCGVY